MLSNYPIDVVLLAMDEGFCQRLLRRQDWLAGAESRRRAG